MYTAKLIFDNQTKSATSWKREGRFQRREQADNRLLQISGRGLPIRRNPREILLQRQPGHRFVSWHGNLYWNQPQLDLQKGCSCFLWCQRSCSRSFGPRWPFADVVVKHWDVGVFTSVSATLDLICDVLIASFPLYNNRLQNEGCHH